MSKLTIAGLVSWFTGGLLFAFQAIGALVRSGGDLDWNNMILMDVIGKSHFDWIAGMPEGIVHNIFNILLPCRYIYCCFVPVFYFLSWVG